MNVEEFKNELKQRIPYDPSEVIRLLDSKLNKKGKIYNNLLLVNSRYTKLKSVSNKGGLSFDNESIHDIRILDTLINIIDSLKEEDLEEQKEAKLLVVCKNNDDKQYMEQYFKALPLNAEVVIGNNGYLAPDDFIMVVFDCHSINTKELEKISEEDKVQLGLMLEYLERAPKYLVYYGEYYVLLNKFREVSTAANNKLTLYARIKEVYDYLKDYKVG